MGPQAAQAKITSEMTLSEKADAIEEHMMHELDKIVTKSVFANMTDGHVDMEGGAALQKKYPGKYFNMGPDPRLPPMPEKPTLLDYFKNRLASTNHLLQSGALGQRHLAGDLGLCGLRSHVTPPSIICGPFGFPGSYTEFRPCDTERQSASLQKWA